MQEINTTPIEPKTERGCNFRHKKNVPRQDGVRPNKEALVRKYPLSVISPNIKPKHPPDYATSRVYGREKVPSVPLMSTQRKCVGWPKPTRCDARVDQVQIGVFCLSSCFSEVLVAVGFR